MRLLIFLLLLIYSCSPPNRETDIGINITLKGDGKYGVTYDSNGATNGYPPLDINSYSEGDLIQIMDGSNLYKDGSRLTRWNLSPDGSGESYYFGQEVWAPKEDLYLYGEW